MTSRITSRWRRSDAPAGPKLECVSEPQPADATTAILPTSRLHISWADKQYDALSGVGYFQILIDGAARIPDSPSNPVQGRVYSLDGVTPDGVTVENMPAGGIRSHRSSDRPAWARRAR